MAEVIDLITPPGSPAQEAENASLQQTHASGKRKAEEQPYEIEDSDSDVEEVPAPIRHPVPTPGASSSSSTAGAAPTSAGSSSTAMVEADDDDSDDDVEMIGRTGDNALEDFPHSRHNCLVMPFKPGCEAKFCENCYCFVCDDLVAKCPRWAEHCRAVHTDDHWKRLRSQWKACPGGAVLAAAPPPSNPAASSAGTAAPAVSTAGIPAVATFEEVLQAVQQVYPVEAATPSGLVPSVRLKPYQAQSLGFMLDVERSNDPELAGTDSAGRAVRGGWLCDEVGMGKTMVAIALVLAHRRPGSVPPQPAASNLSSSAAARNFFGLVRSSSLQTIDDVVRGLTVVVVPNSLVGQWTDEFKKYAPSVLVATFYGTNKEKALAATLAAGRGSTAPTVVITSPNTLLPATLRDKQIHRLIVDESHLIVKAAGRVGKMLPDYVWCLTGTPLTSSTNELERGCRLLGIPPILKTLTVTGIRWGMISMPWTSFQSVPPSADLVARLRKVMIRHTKSQRINGAQALSLPDADTRTVMLTMSPVELVLYRRALKLDGRLSCVNTKPFALDNSIRRRRQASANFYQYKAKAGRPIKSSFGEEESSFMDDIDKCTKLTALRSDLRSLRSADGGMHAVIFTHHAGVHEKVVAMLERERFKVYQISGTVSGEARHRQIRDFQGSGAQGRVASVLVTTVKTGAVGVTLTAATRVYLLEPALDPAAEVQMAGRIHRLGQTKDVHIIRYVMAETVEHNICRLHDAIRAGRLSVANGMLPAAGVQILAASTSEEARVLAGVAA